MISSTLYNAVGAAIYPESSSTINDPHYPKVLSVVSDVPWSLTLWKSVDTLPLHKCSYIPADSVDGPIHESLAGALIDTKHLTCPRELDDVQFSSLNNLGTLTVACPTGCHAQYRTSMAHTWVSMSSNVLKINEFGVVASCNCPHLGRFNKLHIAPVPEEKVVRSRVPPGTPHVIMLVIDSVSRLQMERSWHNLLQLIRNTIPSTQYIYHNTNGECFCINGNVYKSYSCFLKYISQVSTATLIGAECFADIQAPQTIS